MKNGIVKLALLLAQQKEEKAVSELNYLAKQRSVVDKKIYEKNAEIARLTRTREQIEKLLVEGSIEK